MDADEQQILAILRAAKGDAAALALVPLDLVFKDEPPARRERLREAMLAAAVPHWFDAPFLAALLATDGEEATNLMADLRRLTNVEGFPARGETALTVHEASRLPLRHHLRTQHPALWQKYAQRAYGHLAAGKETHERIEALFHLFVADPDRAVNDCDALNRHLRLDPATRAALCLAVTELSSTAALSGAPLIEALRVPLWYRCSRGEVSQLEAEVRELVALARTHAHPSRLADMLCLLGDVHVAHGELAQAEACYIESLRICRELVKLEPASTAWQSDTSHTLNRLAGIAEAKGDLDEAFQYSSESKTIAERLAASDPANAAWQRDLSMSLNNLGDLAVAQGDLAGALRTFKEDKAIAERLAASAPANAAWQRDLSVSLNKLGDLAMAQGDLAGALRSFTESKTIRERLAASDPANAAWQRDLSVSLDKLGDLAVAQGDLAGALRCFTESKTIRERLAASDPANAEWQRDLSVSLNNLGDLAVAQGDLAGALRYFTENKAIAERLAASDPANAAWQRDLSVSCWLIASKIHEPQERWAEALALMEQSLGITERLAAADPTNVTWQKDLSVDRKDVARLREKVKTR